MAGVHRMVLFDLILVVDCAGIFFLVIFDVQGLSPSGASVEFISPDGEGNLETDRSGTVLRGIKREHTFIRREWHSFSTRSTVSWNWSLG